MNKSDIVHTHVLLLHCPCGLKIGYKVVLEDLDQDDLLYIAHQAERAVLGEYKCPKCEIESCLE